jgi:hypothetical protein
MPHSFWARALQSIKQLGAWPLHSIKQLGVCSLQSIKQFGAHALQSIKQFRVRAPLSKSNSGLAHCNPSSNSGCAHRYPKAIRGSRTAIHQTIWGTRTLKSIKQFRASVHSHQQPNHPELRVNRRIDQPETNEDMYTSGTPVSCLSSLKLPILLGIHCPKKDSNPQHPVRTCTLQERLFLACLA